MKTSGGKEILLVLLVLIRCGPQKRRNPVFKWASEGRRMGPNEIEPVEKQKLIVYKKTKPFLFLMYQTLLMYKFLRGTFYDAELTGPLPARLPLRR